MIELFLENKFFNEFRVIDGLNQHPEGLSFEQWKIKHYPYQNNKTKLKVKIMGFKNKI